MAYAATLRRAGLRSSASKETRSEAPQISLRKPNVRRELTKTIQWIYLRAKEREVLKCLLPTVHSSPLAKKTRSSTTEPSSFGVIASLTWAPHRSLRPSTPTKRSSTPRARSRCQGSSAPIPISTVLSPEEWPSPAKHPATFPRSWRSCGGGWTKPSSGRTFATARWSAWWTPSATAPRPSLTTTPPPTLSRVRWTSSPRR